MPRRPRLLRAPPGRIKARCTHHAPIRLQPITGGSTASHLRSTCGHEPACLVRGDSAVSCVAHDCAGENDALPQPVVDAASARARRKGKGVLFRFAFDLDDTRACERSMCRAQHSPMTEAIFTHGVGVSLHG